MSMIDCASLKMDTVWCGSMITGERGELCSLCFSRRRRLLKAGEPAEIGNGRDGRPTFKPRRRH
jgi:hypothetical protein